MLPKENTPIFLIEIIKRPEGPAPEKIRDAWIGTNLIAIEKPPQLNEVDPIKQKFIIGRKAYLVERSQALTILAQKSPEAAQWFDLHFPPDLDALTFGEREVKILGTLNEGNS